MHLAIISSITQKKGNSHYVPGHMSRVQTCECKGEVLLEKVALPSTCADNNRPWFSDHLTYLGVIFPTLNRPISTCWKRSTCKWRFLPAVYRVFIWTHNQWRFSFAPLLVPPYRKPYCFVMHDSATDRNHSRKRFEGACARGVGVNYWGCRLGFQPSETPDHQNSALTFNHVRASHEIRDGNMHFAPCALPHIVSKDAVDSTPRFPGHEVKHTVAICMASCDSILEPAGADPEVRRRVIDFRAQHGTVIINRGQVASHNDFILAWLFVDNKAE